MDIKHFQTPVLPTFGSKQHCTIDILHIFLFPVPARNKHKAVTLQKHRGANMAYNYPARDTELEMILEVQNGCSIVKV